MSANQIEECTVIFHLTTKETDPVRWASLTNSPTPHAGMPQLIHPSLAKGN